MKINCVEVEILAIFVNVLLAAELNSVIISRSSNLHHLIDWTMPSSTTCLFLVYRSDELVDMLKVTFMQYPAIHTNYIISHCTTLQDDHDKVLRQKGNLEHEK